MVFWKEVGLQLRRVPKTADICLTQSRRHLSSRTWTNAGITTQRNTARPSLQQWQGYNTARRAFSVSAQAAHGHITPPKAGEEINITFIDKDGTKIDFQVAEGDNLLDIAQANDLEMEGACGGSCACSTCHVIVDDPDTFDKMEEPSDDENDMLDLAFGLTETSRLGCQVLMTKDLDGMVVRLPTMTRNLQASDFESK
ncbi:unnamed protein product [Penicillium salamii]|uniref:2Fe-2S ferredoxin-type domain-containing protein n=1 Tax=Penicillium salamii TaxID=1612424 RepID=A0A9W4IPF6_9EURO|nr:unnamed protein product [Penicillium salamii]CAG8347301.1 unnamed protein product [Penicillium salamii]CAG8411694.1 unnamed protein product [Penicillium salamii]